MKSCKDISKLETPNLKLNLLQKLQVKAHYLLCEKCRNYKSQIDKISQIYKSNFNKKKEYKILENKIIKKITTKE